MTLNISEPESHFLIQLLNRYVADTKAEIYRTETAGFKDSLKQQEEIAKSLLARLAT
jgi:hypothetical protein